MMSGTARTNTAIVTNVLLVMRRQGRTRIGAQFEYNRFTRSLRAQHPDGSRDDLLAAWRTYRSQPIDERGTIGDDS